MAIDVRTGVLGDRTFQKLRRARVELHHFHSALDLTLGIGKHLSVFVRDGAGEVVGALFQNA